MLLGFAGPPAEAVAGPVYASNPPPLRVGASESVELESRETDPPVALPRNSSRTHISQREVTVSESTEQPHRHEDGALAGSGPSLSEGGVLEPSAPALPDSVPAATREVVTSTSSTRVEAPGVDLEKCLLAIGNALQASHERNGRDILHIVLTAQQEQLAMTMQTLADQRIDYREQLDRAVQGFGEQLGHAAHRLSEELNPEAILQIGELFHASAGQITGALARTERLTGNMIEKQNRLIEGLGILTGQLTRLLTVVTEIRDHGQALVTSSAPPAPPRASPVREPERHLSLVAGHPDVLADIRDELDDDDDT